MRTKMNIEATVLRPNDANSGYGKFQMIVPNSLHPDSTDRRNFKLKFNQNHMTKRQHEMLQDILRAEELTAIGKNSVTTDKQINIHTAWANGEDMTITVWWK